jgi:prepilin-type N-terminal cleavage/methylation domain-containing protein
MFKHHPQPRRKHTWRQGFTLIELLVVISIIGTLVAVFSVSTGHAKESAQIAKATAEAREITNSIRLFALTNMKLDEEGEGYDDPLEQIGVSEGFSDISTTTTTKLTDPKSNDRNVRYFNCSAQSIVKGRIVDPWGNPYKIRVKKIEMGRSEKDKDDLAQEYEVILPLHSHYTELSEIQSDITSSGAIGTN